MKAKLVKESLNEFIDPSGEYLGTEKDPGQDPVQKAILYIGENPDIFNVVSYCWDHYEELSGYPDNYKFDESLFPDEIEELINHYGFDYDDFSQEWGMYADYDRSSSL